MFEFFTALYIAALTGLAFLSYNKPVFISRVHLPLQIIVSYIPLMLVIWFAGVVTASNRLMSFISPDKQAEAKAAVDVLYPDILFVIFVCVISALFLLLMKHLPKLTEKADQMKSQNPI